MVRLSSKTFALFGSPRAGSARIARQRLLRQVRQAGSSQAPTAPPAALPARHPAADERHSDLLHTLLTEGFQS
jgi:hypothetical protein